MSELQIAWLELILVGGLGLILVLSGIIINSVTKKKNILCTKRTEGTVIRYRFLGGGNMYPVIEYFVNGACYKTRKKFYGVKTKRIYGLPIPVRAKAYEDEKGWLCVESGGIVNLRQLAEQLWPIDSKMAVYYNPENPKKCYVDRPLSKSFTTTMFVLMGVFTIILSVVVFFLIQL